MQSSGWGRADTMPLPVQFFGLGHRLPPDFPDLGAHHAEIARWFERRPNRMHHVVLPDDSLRETDYFDLDRRDYEHLIILKPDYGFVPVIIYDRAIPREGDTDNEPAILKRHIFVHSRMIVTDDDAILEDLAPFADDTYVIFPGPGCIEADLFWEQHDRDPDALFAKVWS